MGENNGTINVESEELPQKIHFHNLWSIVQKVRNIDDDVKTR